MVIKLLNFDSDGKKDGPGVTLWDDEARFAMVRNEANGGFTITVTQEDELGYESRVMITLDKIDIEQLKAWTK